MRPITACAALAALSLAACQPASDGAETAEADAAEGSATEAAATDAGGDVIDARLRAGLWQVTMSLAGAPGLTTRACLDERSTPIDASRANSEAEAQVQDCDQTFTRTAEGVDFTSRCDMGEAGVTETVGSMTGDFQTAYRMEATVTTTGAAMGNGSVTMVTEAEHQGPCPEGWSPGDAEFVGPGGARVNMQDLQAQMEAMRQGRGG